MKQGLVHRFSALVGIGMMIAAPVSAAPTSVLALYERVPAVPASGAEAAAAVSADGRVTGAAWLQVRQQISADRKAIETMLAQVASDTQTSMSGAQGIDMARMQSDPVYAERVQAEMQKESARIQALPPAQQMAEAMKMQQRFQQQALQDVQQMAQESPAVEAAVAAFHERMAMQMNDLSEHSAITARIDAIHRKVDEQANLVFRDAERRQRCSDGEGGCATPADEAHDRSLAIEAWNKVKPLYDAGLKETQAIFVEAHRARMAVVKQGQTHLAATAYGAAAKSTTNRQLLGQYHNLMLTEVGQLLTISEDAVAWAGARLHQKSLLGYELR